MTQNDQQPNPLDGPTLPLKNGSGEMEAGWARAAEESLRHLLEQYPDHFQAFWAVVQGRGDGVSQGLRHDLRRWCYLQRDGSPHPDFKTTLLAAVRETPDGFCIVDPLGPQIHQDIEALQRFDQERDERLAKGIDRLIRKLERLEGERNQQDRGWSL